MDIRPWDLADAELFEEVGSALDEDSKSINSLGNVSKISVLTLTAGISLSCIFKRKALCTVHARGIDFIVT